MYSLICLRKCGFLVGNATFQCYLRPDPLRDYSSWEEMKLCGLLHNLVFSCFFSNEALMHSAKKNNITIGEISGVHWGLKERWFWLIFRVLNHILEVSKSGKAPKTKIGSDLAIFGQNLDQKDYSAEPSWIVGHVIRNRFRWNPHGNFIW